MRRERRSDPNSTDADDRGNGRNALRGSPRSSAAMPRTETMPIRRASLSLVPNHWIASSLSHGGTLSMNSLPTASMGETTSMIPATSMPTVTATAPATKPGIAPYRRGAWRCSLSTAATAVRSRRRSAIASIRSCSSFRGIEKRTSPPAPVASQMRPPWASTSARAMARPRPECPVRVSACRFGRRERFEGTRHGSRRGILDPRRGRQPRPRPCANGDVDRRAGGL